jgi:NADPH:quinone reductase-like Zn-dependent oxidoreductase
MSVAGILDEKTDSGRLEFHARRLDPFRTGEGVECPIDKLRNRHPEWFREGFLALLELLRRGEIQPVVAERLPLTEAGGAHELLESSAAMGKLVLVP